MPRLVGLEISFDVITILKAELKSTKSISEVIASSVDPVGFVLRVIMFLDGGGICESMFMFIFAAVT
ncbi:MAG: hypothetical protein ACRC4N_12405 [Gammaproteobacteria bacterium]